MNSSATYVFFRGDLRFGWSTMSRGRTDECKRPCGCTARTASVRSSNYAQQGYAWAHAFVTLCSEETTLLCLCLVRYICIHNLAS